MIHLLDKVVEKVRAVDPVEVLVKVSFGVVAIAVINTLEARAQERFDRSVERSIEKLENKAVE